MNEDLERLADEMCDVIKSIVNSQEKDHWDEFPVTQDVRAICETLLDAAHANGLSGCSLCQG